MGVFVNESAATITQTLDQCDLDLAQLSGDEPVELQEALGNRAYKAIRPQSIEQETEQTFTHILNPDLPLLVDAYHPNLYGGTGETGDWQMAQLLAFDVPKFMLAGGLNPDNIIDAITAVRPWAVDVASGTEATPGKKDPVKVRAFINNVHSVLEL